MKHLLFVFFFLPLTAAAQPLKQNGLDAQSNQKQIETHSVTIKTASDIRMEASLRAAGPSFILQLSGSGIGASMINMNDPVIFLLDNDNTITVKPVAIQGTESNNDINTYKHEYEISEEDLAYLSQHNLQGVRKYSIKGFDDIYPEEKNATNLKTLSAFFLQTLDKANLLKARKSSNAPAFPGGKEVLLSFLNRNLKVLPPLERGEKKKAQVELKIEADGSVNNIQIKQSAGTSYDNELLRVLKRMPKWKPAFQNNKQVNAVVTQEITFFQDGTKVRVQL
jgi:TonB family protein